MKHLIKEKHWMKFEILLSITPSVETDGKEC